MSKTSRLFAVLIALMACGLFATTAMGAKAKVTKTRVKVVSTKQSSLSGGRMKIKLNFKVKKSARKVRAAKVVVKAKSSTFDDPKFKALTKKVKVKVKKSGSKSVKLRLTSAGKKAVKACAGRSVKVTAGKGKAYFDLVRNSSGCKPKNVDLSKASMCDFIGQQKGSLCLLPFPDDFYTKADSSTPTGKRINLQTDAMPQNVGDSPGIANGTHIDASKFGASDGFSQGAGGIVRVPGLDNPAALANTKAVGISKISDYTQKNQPVVVIDTKTGKRWPIWVELDSHATSAAKTTVMINAAKNYDAKHRYIVAMRNLKTSSGATIGAPAGFKYYRDDLSSRSKAINKRRSHFESIFKTLKKAGIDRSNLYLAWDFTVASDENNAGRLLNMRDQAFATLGDTNLADSVATGTAPAFTVNTVIDNPVTGIERRVIGTFQVPCFLTNNCAPYSEMVLDSNGMPVMQAGMYAANFICNIPTSALSTPARSDIYGHGLLGDAGEVSSSPQNALATGHNFVNCATDEIGMADSDVGMAIGALSDLSTFNRLPDRSQQGLLNEMFLSRLLATTKAQGGFLSDPAFHANKLDINSADTIDTSHTYYNGNSQGGIFGGALTAVSPDFTRGSLGVTGMNYSLLLFRSTDFDTYAAVLDPAYPDEMERPLALTLIQMLWDRSDPNGYAHRMTDNPLPNTPAHEVIMNIALGDHQVSDYTANNEARTIGAKAHAPTIAAGRWPEMNEPTYGIPDIPSYPYIGSSIVYWDSGPLGWDIGNPTLGTPPPPIVNLAPRVGKDPHGIPRATPAEQQMVSDFLQPNNVSHITDTCLGAPCYGGTYTGAP